MKSPGSRIEEVLKAIDGFPAEWHQAGTMYPVLLRKIVGHCQGLEIAHSLETGSGVSTLVLSHLSRDHKVFAVDYGNGSIVNAKASPLLHAGTVEFIEGPTQITLPRHVFAAALQLALIDGPHGYPFPDLEYYCIYPHLQENALLIVDDIHIPTIHNLFEFLKADEMFALLETFGNTAFFRRTAAPTFPPTEDNWWRQNYNKPAK